MTSEPDCDLPEAEAMFETLHDRGGRKLTNSYAFEDATSYRQVSGLSQICVIVAVGLRSSVIGG